MYLSSINVILVNFLPHVDCVAQLKFLNGAIQLGKVNTNVLKLNSRGKFHGQWTSNHSREAVSCDS